MYILLAGFFINWVVDPVPLQSRGFKEERYAIKLVDSKREVKRLNS